MNELLAMSKKEAIKIAKQLCYSDKVVDTIKQAKNEYEITRILTAARKK